MNEYSLPQQCAQILFRISEKELLPGRCERTFTAEWRGPKHLLVLVTAEAERAWKTERVNLPWRMNFIEFDPHCNCSVWARADGPLCLTYAAYWLAARMRVLSRFLTVRFVLTLMVWGMAHCELGERITWNCVGRKRQ